MILSAVEANSSIVELSEPAKMALTVGGRTERKNRFKVGLFKELPGWSLSRSEQILFRNCDGVELPKLCEQK